MKNVKTNRGITLIALVVTIIVLLILAAVTIGLVLGQNGIIGKANKAKSATDIASGKDQVQLALANVVADKLEAGATTSDIKAEDLQTELQKIDSSASVTGTNPNFTVKYKVNGTEYEYGINISTQTVTAPKIGSSSDDWDKTATDESYFIWASDIASIEEVSNSIGYIRINLYKNQRVITTFYIDDIYEELGMEIRESNSGYSIGAYESYNEDYTGEYTTEQKNLFSQKVAEYLDSTIIGYDAKVQNLYELKIPSKCKRIQCNYMLADGPSREILGAGVRKVEIPSTVVEIGDNAFQEFSKLQEINIPDSITYIGRFAFGNCTNMKNISIPNSVAIIRRGAFFGCKALESMNISNNITNIEDMTFEHCVSLTSINIPNSVTNISWGAFKGCTSLTSINIPDSVTNIESMVFADCTSLTTVYTNNQTVIDYMNSNYPNITIKPYEESPNL